jgi:lysophospholipase L1-like esterase
VTVLRRGVAALAVLIALTVAVAACGPPPPRPVLGPGRPAPGPGVLGLGDSVMLGAAPALQAAIPGIQVDAVVSRQFHEAPGIVTWLSQTGGLPGTLVVHLGTNGTVRPDHCDHVVNAAGNRRVIIVNLRVPRAWQDTNNQVLLACAARNGTAFVDWFTLSAGHGDWLAADGYHMRPAGAAAYAAAVAAAL